MTNSINVSSNIVNNLTVIGQVCNLITTEQFRGGLKGLIINDINVVEEIDLFDETDDGFVKEGDTFWNRFQVEEFDSSDLVEVLFDPYHEAEILVEPGDERGIYIRKDGYIKWIGK
jgi:hypothetical protein